MTLLTTRIEVFVNRAPLGDVSGIDDVSLFVSAPPAVPSRGKVALIATLIAEAGMGALVAGYREEEAPSARV